MTIHLIRLAVGIETIGHLADVQAARYAQAKKSGNPVLRTLTRHRPRRAVELKMMSGHSACCRISAPTRGMSRTPRAFFQVARSGTLRGQHRNCLDLAQ